jgi:hypothetical protein
VVHLFFLLMKNLCICARDSLMMEVLNEVLLF